MSNKKIEKIKNNDKILLEIPKKLLTNISLMKLIAATNPLCFYNIPKKAEWVFNNFEIAEKSVQKYGMTLQLFSKEIRNNCNIVRNAYENNIFSFIYAEDEAYNILLEEFEEYIHYDLL
jgi:hypothetical protein